jgi:hypothetical protein
MILSFLLFLKYKKYYMLDLESVLVHSPSIVTRKTGNEYILIPVTDNIADMTSIYTLNDTGAFIWDLIDGQKKIEEIIDALAGEYNVDKKSATDDVFDFIDKMKMYLVIVG